MVASLWQQCHNIDTFIIGHTFFVQCRRRTLSMYYFILLIMPLIWALLRENLCPHFSVWDFYPLKSGI